jgi:poly(3-hydroxybutyrate) depolymerase
VDGGGMTTMDGGPTAMTDSGPLPDDAGPPMAEGCITSVSAGHHLFTCDGVAYDVEVSAACAMGGCGLIVDVHGATMTAEVEDRNTNLRMLGAARGYVVVQPTAPGMNALGTTWDPAADDPKVLAFIGLAMRVYRIDVDRVHMTGFSQGGFMSWRMLCDHADLFASVAPAAACGSLFPHCAFSGSERPSREIPVLYIHGTGDNIVSGCYGEMRDAVVSGWSMSPSATVSMDGDHTWTRYTSASGNVFEYIEHDYEAYSTILGGHCMPGSPDIGTSRFGVSGFGCDATSPFDWGETVIAFFEAHPRP